MNQHFPSNPFCSRFVRPGAIDYRFPSGDSVRMIIERLHECQWRGAIVGPHGSGKSTLLHTLIPDLQQQGWQITLLTLHDRMRVLPRGWRPTGARRLIVIDGFEQLYAVGRTWLRFLCSRRDWGLLVTTHAPLGLPEVYRTTTSPELLALLAHELSGGAVGRFSEATLCDVFARTQGNLREAFFDLYDAHERDAANHRPSRSV